MDDDSFDDESVIVPVDAPFSSLSGKPLSKFSLALGDSDHCQFADVLCKSAATELDEDNLSEMCAEYEKVALSAARMDFKRSSLTAGMGWSSREVSEQAAAERKSVLLAEGGTWALLSSLHSSHPPVVRLSRLNADIITDVHVTDPFVYFIFLVKWWCERSSLAASEDLVDFTPASWEDTRTLLMGRSSSRDASIVTHIDPDAVTRHSFHGELRKISPSDRLREEKLLRYVWTHFTAGLVREAADLCERKHQLWRKVSFGGHILSSPPLTQFVDISSCNRDERHRLIATRKVPSRSTHAFFSFVRLSFTFLSL